MSAGPTPTEDDPRFTAWLNDVGPGQTELPPVEVSPPLAAAVTVLAGAATITAGIGWAALGLAINLTTISTAVIVLMVIGTLLITVGGVFAYLGRPR